LLLDREGGLSQRRIQAGDLPVPDRPEPVPGRAGRGRGCVPDRVVGQPRDDTDLARLIARVLPGDSRIPDGAVRARVHSGWVTLEGEVELDDQRRAVERLVRDLRGVLAVTNDVQLIPGRQAEGPGRGARWPVAGPAAIGPDSSRNSDSALPARAGDRT
jgi:hypothetical protein